ncbi:MAG: lamin tail domain-containing protein [Patescibacteria group bacterium]
MSKKILLFLIGFAFLSSFQIARAEVVINEIMYDPENADVQREWVEIYNDTNTDLDLSNWKFLEKIDASNHGLVLAQGSAIVPSGGYALIVIDLAKFLASWSFNGTIYKVNSVNSLNNTGAKLILKNSSGIEVYSYEYASTVGGAGDGNSLQKISGSWSGATPTPGEANETVVPPASPASSTDSGGIVQGGGSGTSATEEKKVEIKKIKTHIETKNLVFANSLVYFESTAFGYYGEQLRNGKYFWNFGDGDIKEINAVDNKKFTHTYFYPGEYVVTLEYFMNYYGDVPNASDQATVKVVPVDIVISKVGDEKDFFVELSNNASYDTDISNWILASDNKSFTIPRNTTFASKKKITLSPKITGFSILDKNTLKLMTMQGVLVFDYGASVVQKIPPLKPPYSPLSGGNQSPPLIRGGLEGLERAQTEIPKESLVTNLEASVIESNVIKNNYSYLPTLISLIFIGTSAGAVYFIRQRRIIPKTGDDFEILDD